MSKGGGIMRTLSISSKKDYSKNRSQRCKYQEIMSAKEKELKEIQKIERHKAYMSRIENDKAENCTRGCGGD
jgi:hypothetical protein